MIRSLALAVCLLSPLLAQAQDDASLLAPLTPHHGKSHKKHHRHRSDLDELAPLNLPTTLSVEIPGNVEGAQVSVDGKPWGQAPIARHAVTPGAHQVSVTRPGFAPFSKRVVVRMGDRARVSAELQAVSGVLTVRSEPPGAQVSLDGAPLGVTPLAQRAVKPGSYELRLHAPGFMDDVARIELRAGRDVVVERTLIPVPRSDRPVQVSLAPAGSAAEPMPEVAEDEVEPPTPWFKRWYVWAGAGAVVAAAAVGLAASSGGTTVGAPPSPTTVCGGPCAGVLTP